MLQAQRGGETPLLGKVSALKLDLLEQKCEFLLCEPRWERMKPGKLCIQTCSLHFACGQGGVSVALDVNFGTLWKIPGAVALFLSVQWAQDDDSAQG